MLAFYKEMIWLRKTHPVLKNTGRKGLEADVVKDKKALVLMRQYHENLIICIINFEDSAISVEMTRSRKSLFVLLDSCGDEWRSSRNTVFEGPEISVGPNSVLILSDVKGIINQII